MDTQLKTKIVTLLKKMKSDGLMDPLFIQLDNGNYYMEVVWYNKIWSEWSYDTEQIPICYLYNYEIIDNRNKLRNKLKPTVPPNPKPQMAKDFASMSFTLGNFYLNGLLKEIDELIIEYDNYHRYNINKIDIEGGMAFLINGVIIMHIDAVNFEKGLEYGFTEKEFLSEIHSYTEVNNICTQSFFLKFHQDTQFYLKVATELLELVYDSDRKDLLDYSPLLMNYIKAIENETKELFLLHQRDILLITPRIIQNLQNINKDDELSRFAAFCKILNKHTVGYQPSGLKPLFFLFKYFFLRAKSEMTGISKDIIKSEKKEILVKEAKIIDEIFRIGEIRNDLIHKRTIDSKTEFFWHYNDLYSILQIIASIK